MYRTSILILLVLGGTASGEVRKLAITADVGICAHRREVALNTGRNSRIRIKGNEHYYLFDFDVRGSNINIKNYRILSATLHVKLARGKLRRVAICTVPSAWVEGTAAGKPQDGSTCYTHLKYPKVAWTPGGGTMMDATFNSPDMMWRTSPVRVKKLPSGWLEIPIDPLLVQAVAAGLSHGLVLSSETGQTRENHDIFTREQSNAKPYLTVRCQPPLPKVIPPRPPVPAAPFPQGAGFGTGAIAVKARLAGAVFANQVTVSLGAAAKPVARRVVFRGGDVIFTGLKPGGRYLVSVSSPMRMGGMSHTQRVSAVIASPALSIPRAPRLGASEKLEGVRQGDWRVAIMPAASKAPPTAVPPATEMHVPVTPRNAWVGLQVVISPPKGKAADITVELPRIAFAGQAGIKVRPLTWVYAYRIWSVPKDGKHHGEVLVPLKFGEKFSIPWRRNSVAAQESQAIFIDVWVPKDATPGPYAGQLIVMQAGRKLAALDLKLRVAATVLSDTFHIAGDMNTYSSPARAMGLSSSNAAAFLAAEREYYRLAHAHRMTLNVLPYSQSGLIDWRSAPKISGRGRTCKVTDWSGWDSRYGPLLDGSAFSAKSGYVGPGADTPLRHIYLPFHENWPSPLADGKNFRPFPPPRDYQKLLLWLADLPPIAECLGADVGPAWTGVLRQFTQHLAEKGWRRTQYQVYLNNKYYFRRNNGRGISLWLLDEPMAPDDFLALRHFGQLTKTGVLPSSPTVVHYRIDISRPTHQRNWLDGLVDLNVCANQLYSQRRLIARRKRDFGEEYWNYRMPPSFTSSNIGWAVWPVRSFCWGATGTLPWQTIASDGDLQKADATALMYPGRKFGVSKPLASLRMKAWRQGLQDAELLRMLKAKRGWGDLQLRAFVGQACGLAGWKSGMDPKADDGIVTFAGITDAKLTTLRRAVLAALAGN